MSPRKRTIEELALNSDEIALVANALRLAAGQYAKDAAATTEPRLVGAFSRQERAARELAELFEDADEVVVQEAREA